MLVSPADRYARQMTEPGFEHRRLLALRLALAPSKATASVLGALCRQGAALGFETQFHANGIGLPSLPGTTDALRLNPRLRIKTVSPERLLPLLRAIGPDVRTLAVADVDAKVGPSQTGAELIWVARVRSGVVFGRNRRAVADAARRVGAPEPDDGGGVSETCAAACLLADLVAMAGVWKSPDGPMPVPGDLQVLLDPEPRAANTSLDTLLVVGGGGALSHGFLEALIRDGLLRSAFRRVVVVDPDVYEPTNANRQTLMGSSASVGRPKAEVTARELARRWPVSERLPEIVAVPEPISPGHIDRYRPDVTCLLADNFQARHVAYAAVRALGDGRLVVCAGTEFTFGQTRAVRTDSGTCFDHGPERLAKTARREGHVRAPCGAEATPANVLTNALVGAHVAAQVRLFVARGEVEPRQRLVNWLFPERWRSGPAWPGCACSGSEAS